MPAAQLVICRQEAGRSRGAPLLQIACCRHSCQVGVRQGLQCPVHPAQQESHSSLLWCVPGNNSCLSTAICIVAVQHVDQAHGKLTGKRHRLQPLNPEAEVRPVKGMAHCMGWPWHCCTATHMGTTATSRPPRISCMANKSWLPERLLPTSFLASSGLQGLSLTACEMQLLLT